MSDLPNQAVPDTSSAQPVVTQPVVDTTAPVVQPVAEVAAPVAAPTDTTSETDPVVDTTATTTDTTSVATDSDATEPAVADSSDTQESAVSDDEPEADDAPEPLPEPDTAEVDVGSDPVDFLSRILDAIEGRENLIINGNLVININLPGSKE